MRTSVVLPLVMLCVYSCSVKENRMLCPCVVDVTLYGSPESKVKLSFWNSGLEYTEDLDNVADGSTHQCLVIRGESIISACSGLRHKIDQMGNIILTQGEQMDELFACCENLDARGENQTRELWMKKQFAYIHINIEYLENLDTLPLIELRGNCNGIFLPELRPVRGPFRCSVIPVFGQYCRISVPRQFDDSMSLYVEGRTELPIGKYIADSGYDWTSESLDDIYIDVNVLLCVVSVRIASWEQGEMISYKY